MLYSHICPVCNGIDDLRANCLRCGAQTEDWGKESDFYGPYSPYRPINDLKMTNGYPDLERRQCVHAVFCPSCGTTSSYAVDEL
ncbi:hypothetical protein [Paenibacillus alkalitolerans]|uniref:hypothetical protein n=1 Tax=Paenibacillus alkalitolerans TaxID=2799335 RepID=UPI001F2F9ABF|nr:hypothetical protein [Paenibacillus alkalitolerans]